MTEPLQHADEPTSNADRAAVARSEPRALRTFTPTQAVLARSAGVFHWTPEGRQLYDFTSGVLVANLGHNPTAWLRRFWQHLGWSGPSGTPEANGQAGYDADYVSALPLTAYNAVTPVEARATEQLLTLLQSRP